MRKLFFNALSLTLLSLILLSCEKEEKTYLGSLTVKLQPNTNYPTASLIDVEVKLINTTDNITRNANTDASGTVIFTNIPVGQYNVSTSIRVSAGLTLNGVMQSITISASENKSVNVQLTGVPESNNFIIKEIFFAGKQDYDQKDRFFEIYNNSDKTLYADGLHFADLAGNTGSSANDPVLDLTLDTYYYAMRVAKIPGSGTTYPVLPGKSIVIAFNAINFKESFNPNNWAKLTIEDYLDLSKADFEMYAFPFLQSKGFTGNKSFDIDNPSVPNVDILFMQNAANNAFFTLNAYGPALVIFRPEGALNVDDFILAPTATPNNRFYYLKIPVKFIIDGVDVLDNSSSAKFKRTTNVVDAGFTYLKANGNAFYSNMSIRRKVDRTEGSRKILMDTNNSSNDFEAIARPTPKNY